MINLITRISVVGIATTTAALVILLSAFNGIETMIEKLYSEYDTDITVRVKKGKSFHENRLDFDEISEVEGVSSYSRVVEDVVILKHEKKWANAKMIGVETSFLQMTNMADHMVAGVSKLNQETTSVALIGASLLERLGAYIPNLENEFITCYAPKRDIRIRPGKSPFYSQVIPLSGSINFNREVNSESFIVPITLGKELLGYDDQITAVYINAKPEIDNEQLKNELKQIVGDDFTVKTNFEKNEIIYMTSKSERFIVAIILVFIFILAAFNLVASLTMLFFEKLGNIKTMKSIGASKTLIFRIFFFEGLLIAGKGVFFGLLFGYAICFVQQQYGLIAMPNSNGEAFPIAVSLMDGVIIFTIVSVLSAIFSYFPVKYLIQKNSQLG